jgi:hypothetical protein
MPNVVTIACKLGQEYELVRRWKQFENGPGTNRCGLNPYRIIPHLL